MATSSEGIFSDVLSRMGIGKLANPPKMSTEGFELTLTEAELLTGFTAGMDARTKGYVSVKCEQGRLTIRLKM